MQRLAVEYARAKAEQTVENQEACHQGQAGTARHKLTGEAAFGPPTREVQLSKRKKQMSAMATYLAAVWCWGRQWL